jgi:hypothetical protein
MFAASIVLLGVGLMVAPAETSARSGGFVAAPAWGAARPSVATPISARPSWPQRMTGAFPASIKGFRMSRRFEHRLPGFPTWWGYASYPPDYYPSEYAAPYGEVPYAYPSMENFSERSRPVVTYQPGCRTDTQKVPSESGGERSINITRCY